MALQAPGVLGMNANLALLKRAFRGQGFCYYNGERLYDCDRVDTALVFRYAGDRLYAARTCTNRWSIGLMCLGRFGQLMFYRTGGNSPQSIAAGLYDLSSPLLPTSGYLLPEYSTAGEDEEKLCSTVSSFDFSHCKLPPQAEKFPRNGFRKTKRDRLAPTGEHRLLRYGNTTGSLRWEALRVNLPIRCWAS